MLWKAGSLTALELTKEAGWVAGEPQGPPCPFLTSSGITSATLTGGGFNSGPSLTELYLPTTTPHFSSCCSFFLLFFTPILLFNV